MIVSVVVPSTFDVEVFRKLLREDGLSTTIDVPSKVKGRVTITIQNADKIKLKSLATRGVLYTLQ